MIWETLKYILLLLVISLVMIIEHAVAVPFMTFTLFVLAIWQQQPVMMVLMIVFVSLLASTLFGVGWLLVFLLLALAVEVIRHWRQFFSRTWWGPGFVSLSMTVVFSLLVPMAPPAQFLVFSLLSLITSLGLLWIIEMRRTRIR